MAITEILHYWRLKALVTIFRALSGWRQGPFLQPPDHVQREFIQIPSREPSRTIKAWLYYPAECRNQTITSAKATLINWHGSGFINPSLGLDHEFCGQIARENGILVLDVDYRKGPEHPYPAAMEDVQDILSWVESEASTFDSTRIAVSGFSSGGTLALVAASSLRSSCPNLNVKMVLSFYPCTDLSIDPATKTVPQPVRPIPSWIQNVFYDSYAPDIDSRKDPHVSPSYADVALFPDMVTCITCSGDTLEPEANDMVAKLNDGTRRMNHVRLKDVAHGFDKGCTVGSRDWEQKELAYLLASRDLRDALQ